MKQLCVLLFVVSDILLSATGLAVPDVVRKKGTNVKVENGSTAVWLVNSVLNVPQVYVFSNSGNKRVELDLVSHLSGTDRVSIYDVSIGKSGRIAAGVVAVGRGGQAVALLLAFSPEGKMMRALGLDSSREITRLIVDDDDSMWTLCGDGTGEFLIHYSPAGNELGAFVGRSEIPEAADSVDDLKRGVFTSFGLRGNRLWFWVMAPAATIVSVNRDGSILAREQVALERPAAVSPQADPQLLRAVQLEDGSQAIQVAWVGERRRDLAVYVRNPGQQAWRVDHRGHSGRLVGADGSKLAFLQSEGAAMAIDWR